MCIRDRTDGTDAADTTEAAATGTIAPIGGPDRDGVLADRPAEVYVPSSYDGTVAVPLVVLLHGYTASGAIQEGYFRVQPLAEELGFLYVHPDGTVDDRGQQFWNGTDACCNLFGADIDDVTYLSTLIAEVQATYDVDPARIFLVGHSNGGFMSYRMACERSDLVAAIASLAGATFADTASCAPSEPVSVLQIHGTSDGTIAYTGGEILGHPFPSAAGTVADWAAYDGCGDEPSPTGATLDLEADLAGDDSSVEAYAGCPDGIDVELWTIDGGSHSPNISPSFTREVIEFLLAHPKT